MISIIRRVPLLLVAALAALPVALGVGDANAQEFHTISTDFQGELFGLNVGKGDTLLVADAGAGPTKLDVEDGETKVLATLPGVVDVIRGKGKELLAVTGGGEPGTGAATLYRIKNGTATQIADLAAFEVANNPADDDVNPNPFDLARLGNKTLVADAGGNSLLVVNKKGEIDWVATFPTQELPPGIPADAVPTTVAIGPDGGIYVGELTGFPATPGASRIWRIDPDARHVRCGTDPECQLVSAGFTSIIDINFGPDGTLYVVELDEASFLAAEGGEALGGTVNACQLSGGGGDEGNGDDDDDDGDDDDGDDDDNGVTLSCTEHATGLTLPTAVAVTDADGEDNDDDDDDDDDEGNGVAVYVTLFALIPGEAQVALLP